MSKFLWQRLLQNSIALVFVLFRAGITNAQTTRDSVSHAFPSSPAWVQDQTMYEVNLRSFSDTGDVEGLRAQLPRLKEMGVGIVWVMPINPIGEVNHAGKLGSPYAVKDFKGFNPEFGTIEQFKTMIDQAHRMGLYIIIDWVANHTALDNPWVTQHPDWYKHDEKGQLVHPLPTWADVVALNFDSRPMREEMINSMAFWVKEVGVDGFRCDSAEFVPVEFWSQARDALRKIKPVFLLGEGGAPALTRNGFDASYAWNLPSNMEGIAKGTKTVADLVNFMNADQRDLEGSGFRLNYTSNHDKNAWEGTTKELLGNGVPAFTVLTFTLPGMPLIFNGQEAGDERRLNFFDRDPIKWQDSSMAALYKSLSELKRDHRALWSCEDGAPAIIDDKSTSQNVLCFRRQLQGHSVVVMINLSGSVQEVAAPEGITTMRLALSDEEKSDSNVVMNLKPWSFRVWVSDH